MTTFYSPDYPTARERFRGAAARAGWLLEARDIGVAGPDGDALTIDVATSPDADSERTLVVSSGLHGVEGFFGSAVQLALLERWQTSPPPVRCVLLHGLNPYGFAWLRRFDDGNIDPNRNFLLPGEEYAGAPAGYAALDPFLNPRCPPSRWEPFRLKAMWMIARYGMAALRQAIAAGQYDFPQGLFFGGHGPSRTLQVLENHLPRWLAGSRTVVHLDLHTGLGTHGTWKLLIDAPLADVQRQRLVDWYGTDRFETSDVSEVAYEARGGWGRWCTARGLADDYLYACAEFGTYDPVTVLAGLRAENRAHHWGKADSPATRQVRLRVKELFCPVSDAWRQNVLGSSLEMVETAARGLAVV